MSDLGEAVEARTSPPVSVDAIPGIRRRVIDLAGPALVEMFLVTLVGMADMIMVGRIGPAAIAAVGLTNQPMFLAQAVFMALNVGTTAVIARAVGAGMREVANDALRQSFMLTVMMGIGVSVLGVLSARGVIVLMGAEEDVIPLGAAYMRIVAAGLVFMLLTMNVAAALRGAGDTTTPMKVNTFCNVLNVIGNYVLIYGKLGFPRMGVAGAALSTSVSRAIAFALILRAVTGGRFALHLTGPTRLDAPLIRRIVRIGIPAAIEQIILRGGQLAYLRIVAGFGTAVVASHQIAMNILGLSFMPGQAFAVAATTLVGQGLGARRPDLAERGALETRRIGMIVSGFMAFVFILFGRYIAMLYSNDPIVVAKTAIVLRIIGLVQPAQSTQFILAGGLRGAGDTKWPLYSTAVGIWGFRVALGYVLAVISRMELVGAWIAMAIDQVVRSAIITFRFRGGRWKLAKP
ncbi:MAG: MATE family efflux transporter [Firmicutes bacterium]|jgi:putative MATE family efflux protein|nr:MATE family efflux transporter [Bacillota bacterium]MDH7494460.1 MATE family efflux transporter [Bacillota bacterium]